MLHIRNLAWSAKVKASSTKGPKLRRAFRPVQLSIKRSREELYQKETSAVNPRLVVNLKSLRRIE